VIYCKVELVTNSIQKCVLNRVIVDWINKFKLDENGWHDFRNITFAVYRGFWYWLHHGKMVSDEVIAEHEYPSDWIEPDKKESKPLALSMAIELYFLGEDYGIYSLEDFAMNFIFNHYRKNRTMPSTVRVSHIYYDEDKERKMYKGHLQLFCVDLYYLFGEKNITKMLDRNEDTPREFLGNIFRRHCQLIIDTDRTFAVEYPTLKLKDYMHNVEFYAHASIRK
jgi:hypothetical protein